MLSSKKLLIESQYLGSIEYYAYLVNAQGVIIEKFEHFEKSSYRNRCYISSPQGKLRLSIPLLRSRNQRKPIYEIKIANDMNWQKVHWNSLITSYRSSPYFEYYEEHFYPFYHKPFTFLLDFNLQLNEVILKLLQINLEINLTASYKKDYSNEEFIDFRSKLVPTETIENVKPFLPNFAYPIYYQIFADKTQFIPNLSIVDLLFSEGKNSLFILKTLI